ncbi:hypothetical protein [Streptosporangium canum]|uniref:hypothetical protein n=1 Tax=Streptosporangium canum TaxID=324952 RepID=UPI00379BCAC5
MRHTEAELTQVLVDRASGVPGTLDLAAITRRVRRYRRRRAMAGALAAAAAVTATIATVVNLAMPAQAPPPAATSHDDSAAVASGVQLPKTFERVGENLPPMPLIHSERFDTVGPIRTISYTSLSADLGYVVVCEDPRAWVVLRSNKLHGIYSYSVRRCGRGDPLHAPGLKPHGPQTMEVAVLPADAPLREPSEIGQSPGGDGTGSPRTLTPQCPRSSVKKCGGKYSISSLNREGMLERVRDEIGERPGTWAIGIYDSAARTPSPS